MARVVHQTSAYRHCALCRRGALAARTRSHSMRQTNRTIWKNLQKTPRGLVCTKCLKSHVAAAPLAA